MPDGPLLVRIWGARGSIPAPAKGNCIYGSDSPCVEVRCGSHVLVFDVGSGAVSLGERLAHEGVKDLDILLSHCHLDHLIGLPFFKPFYNPNVSARLHAGHFLDDMTCRNMAERFMAPPFFPVTPKVFRAQIEFRDFRPPDGLQLHGDIDIRTVRLNHPNGAVGYRVNYKGRSFCYCTDTEHEPGILDPELLAWMKDADILLYDCMYTDAEFEGRRGFGHSTWQHGVRLCEGAGVKQLIIFHHSPGRYDDELQQLEAEAQARFPGALVGRTGLELRP